jgi:MoxR-like ATPase
MLLEVPDAQAPMFDRFDSNWKRPSSAMSMAEIETTALAQLIGRDGERDRLRAALMSARVVVVTGPVGVGKSALAVDVARRR